MIPYTGFTIVMTESHKITKQISLSTGYIIEIIIVEKIFTFFYRQYRIRYPNIRKQGTEVRDIFWAKTQTMVQLISM